MEQRFWDILAKKLCQEASPSELEELDLLMSENKHFTELANDAVIHNNSFNVDASTIKIDVEKAWESIQNKKVIPLNTSKSKLRWMAGVAASVVVILSSVWFYNTQNSSTVYLSSNENNPIVLADGTTVWLNANSELTVNFNDENRKVTLVGEAYFEVVENVKPFIVKANSTQTKVLGTHFNIKAIKNDLLVTTTLFTGKVQFTTDNDNVILTPFHYAAYNTNSNQLITDTLMNNNNIAWKDGGIIKFEEANFRDVLSTIESCYHINVIVENQDIYSCNFTGSFSKPNLEELLEVIAVSLNISY
ncbi:MAG: FecR family protein, partial [Flavobacteriales bacterium]|nr:FecR family protein [Flavobacteriales bacterium]